MSKIKIKRKCLSIADKLLVLREFENKKTQNEIAKQFGISQTCVSNILKQKEIIHNDTKTGQNLSRKRKRAGNYEDVDEALFRWFKQARTRNIPMNGPLLKFITKVDQNVFQPSINVLNVYAYLFGNVCLHDSNSESA